MQAGQVPFEERGVAATAQTGRAKQHVGLLGSVSKASRQRHFENEYDTISPKSYSSTCLCSITDFVFAPHKWPHECYAPHQQL